MRIAIIYSDRRGEFVARGFKGLCELVKIDLSGIEIRGWHRLISALISFHSNRTLWKNDFYRNPIAVIFRKKAGEKEIKKINEKVDAVLQFGLMNTYDYSFLGSPKVFYYLDGAHDPNNPYWYCPRFGKWFSNMQVRAYSMAAGIFTFSKWARKQHIEQLGIPGDKLINVGWGPCLNVNDASPKDVLNDPPCFLFIGRNSPRKGLDILVAAFTKVQELYSKAKLNCVGINDKEYSDKKINGMIFHGYCRGDKLKSIIKASDVFVLPSRYDRSPHSVIEAMNYGVVPIVTSTCGAPEPVLAGGCGVVVPPEDPGALADAMISLIEDRENLRKFSARAFKEAHKNWTWEKVCGRMLKHIEGAL